MYCTNLTFYSVLDILFIYYIIERFWLVSALYSIDPVSDPPHAQVGVYMSAAGPKKARATRENTWNIKSSKLKYIQVVKCLLPEIHFACSLCSFLFIRALCAF